MTDLTSKPGLPDADLLLGIIDQCDLLLVKKLSNNDREWAIRKRDSAGLIVPGKWMNNQAGPYIPVELRDSGFFPRLELQVRTDGKTEEIWKKQFQTNWPQHSDTPFGSQLINYRSKGPETHLTGLPKAAFSTLSPASYLVMGRRINAGQNPPTYECMTIDSSSELALFLEEVLDLKSEFLMGIYDPALLRQSEEDKLLDFADAVIAAWLKGEIREFALSNATMPNTQKLSQLAREKYLQDKGIASLSPFDLDSPGDTLRDISRNVEYELFREFQRRERAVDLVRITLGNEPAEFDASKIIRRLVERLQKIDALMLSASQQRKSRAGYSYEHHIEAMLQAGGIPHQKQVIVEARKRPDFVVPTLSWIDAKRTRTPEGLILSAKTTLRERWKQVEREKGKRRLFLTTLDENIANNAIDDMASFGVQLVVPESLKTSNIAVYEKHDNVLSFKELCEIHIRPHMSDWPAVKP